MLIVKSRMLDAKKAKDEVISSLLWKKSIDLVGLTNLSQIFDFSPLPLMSYNGEEDKAKEIEEVEGREQVGVADVDAHAPECSKESLIDDEVILSFSSQESLD